MDKKYELIESDIRGLYRVKALIDFGNVKKGDVGGYVENKHNLSQKGECWIYNNAMVYNNAKIYNNAKMYDNAEMFHDAIIDNNAQIYGESVICGNAHISGNVEIQEGRHIGRVIENFQSILYIQCKKRLITVYKDINNITKCNIGCQRGMTLTDLINRIEEDGGMNEHREEYVRIMQNAHLLLG